WCADANGKQPAHFAAHHLCDEVLACRLSDIARVHAPAVAQHGVSAGDLPHFLEEMADVDHRHPVGGEAPDQLEQAIHILALEPARRLVHEENARVRRQGAADLDYLLRGDGERADAPVRMVMRVRLPAPFSPISARTSPGSSVKSTPSSATVAPNRLATPRISSRLIAR